MPPSYVKAYVKRSKNDANDAAAICEAVTRPSMRFVATKSEQQQSGLMLHRSRQLLVCQAATAAPSRAALSWNLIETKRKLRRSRRLSASDECRQARNC